MGNGLTTVKLLPPALYLQDRRGCILFASPAATPLVVATPTSTSEMNESSRAADALLHQ